MFIPLKPTQDAVAYSSTLEDTVREELVKNCVQAAITLSQNRLPIKKVDLHRLVFSNHNNYRITGAIIQLANKELNKTFGMRLYELEDKTRYLLVNSKVEFSELMTHSDTTCDELAVLYFILMDIFVSPEEKISEEDIEKSLKPLNFPSETIKTFLESFVKKLYLTHERRQDVRLFSWGPRAVAEVEPENFFQRFLELSGHTEKDWPEIKRRIDKLKSMPNRYTHVHK